MHKVIVRKDMLNASLDLGGQPIDLADYATTGLVMITIGPKGHGKTNVGLLVAEQLSSQGWVSVLIDPEHELESLYGLAVGSPNELADRLKKRDKKIVVVSAPTPDDFIPYGEVILKSSDRYRKPIFVMVDEGQLFSSSRKKDLQDANKIINDMVGRGRKRALDLFITAHRMSGSLDRMVFSNKDITLFGRQDDPAAWSMLSAQFRHTGISFGDLNELQPGEFMMVSRRGHERVRMPMAEALKSRALKSRVVPKNLPSNYRDWVTAVAAIPDKQLVALNTDVTRFLSKIAGLTADEYQAGLRALNDELEARSGQ